MRYRLWYVVHSLPQREEQKLREYLANRTGTEGQVTIKYRKKKMTADVDLDSEEKVQDFIKAFSIPLNPPIPGREDVLMTYATLFGMCPAEDGEKVRELEGAWKAEEVPLL